MAGFWPWSRDDSSPASFEKTLSTLSTKITDTQVRLDRLRSSSRRNRVLSTLYLSFAYLVAAIVLLLVVGYKNLGTYEWTGLAAGPVVIYTTRKILSAIYTFRIESLAARLKEYQQDRTKTIQKLKDATKYDSTMELIEKYGGAESSPKSKKTAGQQGESSPAGQKNHPGQGPSTPGAAHGRTRMPPPPTANIQRRDGHSQPSSPMPGPDPMEPGAEFAPNADFAGPSPHLLPPGSSYDQSQFAVASAEPHWYDRIFDVLLGEDETAPRNRIALICQSCRLVNGQAPPGTKALSELGLWKCMACGASNGELDEGKRIVNEVLEARGEGEGAAEAKELAEADSLSEDMVDVAKESVIVGKDSDVDDGPAAAVKRRRGKGKR